ncbi:Sapep family Mn(2+)-dependent dipeptidase [Metaplanococcus flavidus]|uniref:Sapep family Mn(2+)-dependent dipeptidase n=1 Tax=Metaplanococcus flavidus TaxID=569883 RepID=A0ABW3LBK8_9BACL
MEAINKVQFAAYLEDLKSLIAIPSVKGPAKDFAPYGEEVKKALDYYLSRAQDLGLNTFEIDHKVGVVEFGSGEEEVAIFVHIDVVPAEDAENWRFPPFTATEYEGSLYGRGTLDDKGPALAVLYALAALQQKNFQPKRRVRIVIGGDEESGMDCIATYKKMEKPPTIGFTPDGYFPVTYSEKGILVKEVTMALSEQAGRLELYSGKAQNVEPSQASGSLVMRKEPAGGASVSQTEKGNWEHSFSIKKQNEDDRVIFRLLKEVAVCLNEPEMIKKIQHAITLLADESGMALGIETMDEHSGALTMQATKLRFDQGILKFTLNIRYPSSADAEEMEAKVIEALKAQGFETKTIDSKAPIYFDPEKPFIKSMTKIYRDTTNRDDEPMAISGGTYARAYPDRVVAFGALFPTEPLNAHAVNEHVKLSVMEEWLHVYEIAIEQLANENITP